MKAIVSAPAGKRISKLSHTPQPMRCTQITIGDVWLEEDGGDFIRPLNPFSSVFILPDPVLEVGCSVRAVFLENRGDRTQFVMIKRA
ncbi:MAG: hypothetical protein EA367_06350 [Leptolyngbya sp. DLM2.Bin15]|nr:MAG: hypothetical protein EA367_06350 [Leptolyngbya sp. DLM2.Bin15]